MGGQPLLREQQIPSRDCDIAKESNFIISDEIDDGLNNSIKQNYGAEAVWKMSQQSQSLLDTESNFCRANNIPKLQCSILDMASLLKQGSNNKYQSMVGLVGELHRITEDDEDDHNEAIEDLRNLIHKWTKKVYRV